MKRLDNLSKHPYISLFELLETEDEDVFELLTQQLNQDFVGCFLQAIKHKHLVKAVELFMSR